MIFITCGPIEGYELFSYKQADEPIQKAEKNSFYAATKKSDELMPSAIPSSITFPARDYASLLSAG